MFATLRKLFTGRQPRRLSGRRFLCPNCLRWGGFRYACGGCWLAVKDKLVNAQGACPRYEQVDARASQAHISGNKSA